ncbi:MAG: hypothetical protein IH621_08960 [Krumholzibacteria bacterium]|nr:hypothetical protein [Candidatus Krumholzibacteria bacterium]
MALLQWLKDHKPQLADASGDTIMWRPIGPPGWTDSRYQRMRTARLKERDEADAERYRLECAAIGGNELHDREEFERIAAQYGLECYRRPLVFFITTPDTGARAVLEIDVKMLDTLERRRKLGEILCARITEVAISKLSEGGVYTSRSLADLQAYLDRVREEVDQYLAASIEEATRPPAPLLTLKSLPGKACGDKFVARLVGTGPLSAVDKKIGVRQAFFLFLLFDSEEERRIDGVDRSVVSESRAVEELRIWAASGFIKLEGADRENPAHRVMKMWGEFTRQLEKSPPLRGMFERMARSEMFPDPLYTIKIGNIQSQILIPNMHALLASRLTASE